MDTDLLATWRRELESARQLLSSRGAMASIRGDGIGIFLVAEHDDRAVELCGNDGGGYNVEVWDAGQDSSDHDVDVPGIKEAVQASQTWLFR